MNYNTKDELIRELEKCRLMAYDKADAKDNILDTQFYLGMSLAYKKVIEELRHLKL